VQLSFLAIVIATALMGQASHLTTGRLFACSIPSVRTMAPPGSSPCSS